jgi:hypothetical protein
MPHSKGASAQAGGWYFKAGLNCPGMTMKEFEALEALAPTPANGSAAIEHWAAAVLV